MVILFSHPKPRNHLLEHGEVYTFRLKQRKHVGNDWAATGRGKPKFADVRIIPTSIIKNFVELKPFVAHSGFKTLDEWIDAITGLTQTFLIEDFSIM